MGATTTVPGLRPRPARTYPATGLLLLVRDVLLFAHELEQEAAEGGLDRDEVVGKLDGLQTLLIEGREEYLAAFGGGGQS